MLIKRQLKAPILKMSIACSKDKDHLAIILMDFSYNYIER